MPLYSHEDLIKHELKLYLKVAKVVEKERCHKGGCTNLIYDQIRGLVYYRGQTKTLNLRLNNWPFILQRANVAVNLGLNMGPCIYYIY